MTPKGNKRKKCDYPKAEKSPEIGEKFQAFVKQTNDRINELITSKIVELKEAVRNELKSSYDDLKMENDKNLKIIDELSARLNELEKGDGSTVTLEDIFEQGVRMKNDNQAIIDQNKLIRDQLKVTEEGIMSVTAATCSTLRNTKELKDKVISVEDRMRVVEDDNEKFKDKIKAVDARINRQHQSNLKKCMEIKGLSGTEMQNVRECKQLVVTVLERLGIRCEASQIERAYKSTVPNSDPQCEVLMVWFRNIHDKERIMIEKYEIEIKGKQKSGIFLNHALTGYNRALISKARKVKEQIGMSIVNFSNGRIKMKARKGDKPTVINSFEELENLLLKR